jgi:O-antigen/teichoic acid export membrane protein
MKPVPAERGLHDAGAVKLVLLFAAAQGILLLLSPAIARLYSPEEIGQFAIFGALVLIGAYTAMLRFDQVIIVARTRDHALHAAALALACAAAAAAAVTLAHAAGLENMVAGMFGERARTWSGFLGSCILLAAVAIVASSWLLRNARFGAVGIVRIVQTGLVAVLGVVFGLAGVHTGLIVAQVAGLVLTGGIVGALLARDISAARWPTARRLCGLTRRYREFVLKGTPAALVDILVVYLPLLLFGQIFGDVENGHFALARQCLLGVYVVLAASAGQAFMLSCTQCVRDGGALRTLLFRQLKRQAVLAAGLLLGALFFAQPLFGWLFGERWFSAGVYAMWLAVPISAALLVSPVSGLLLAVERVGANGAWQVGHMICVAALVLFPYGGPVAFLAALAVVEVVCYAAYLALIVHGALEHDRGVRL